LCGRARGSGTALLLLLGAKAAGGLDAKVTRLNAEAASVGATAPSMLDCVGRASGSGAEAMSKVAGVTTDARSTASDVKDLADAVAIEAENLEAEVRQFLANVQAA